eukprot:Tamp_07042.p1 GENE.Tamp_07042~~Tamp_07042.p1  ORF type:complete len:394 (+),score=75.45 Tamp_07042:501-1682(+)
MKALDGGCSDAQLQALLTKVHENGGYSDEEWDGQYREWPPEPEFAQDSETGQPLEEHSQVQRLAALAQQTAAAGLGDDADMEEGDNLAGQVPRGFLELQLDAVDSEDTLSTYTEDSKSDDDYVTPPTPPMQDKPIPGCTMLVHSSPDPAKRVPEEEGGVQESESSSEVNSSEQERRVRRQQHHVEYTADGLLAADAQFQEKMRRWRAGLPNFERPAPTTSPSFDSEQDDRYDFVGSHDEAAEPFSSTEGTALGQCFRDGLLAPRAEERTSTGAGGERGEQQGGQAERDEHGDHAPAGGEDRDGGGQWNGRETAAAFQHRVGMPHADFARLRAVSKDIHHRRLWGVPPGTSFGVFDPWVNPYYKQPLRMRRVTPEERAAVQGRGWTHAVDIDAL